MSSHFPGFTVYPGVFILEGLRQTVLSTLAESDGCDAPEVTAVRRLRFLAPILEGDTLRWSATISSAPGVEGAFAVAAEFRRADGRIAATAEIELRRPHRAV